MTPTTRPEPTPVQQLKPSQLRKLAPDIDVQQFNLQMRNKAGIKLVSAITDAVIERTIDGASTLTVTVDDDNSRTIQKSGRLGRKVDTQVDGLWWTLVSIKKAKRSIVLTFEEREVNVLRYYSKLLTADRNKITRAQFVLRMIKEVKEVPLKYVIPELKTKQEVSDVAPGQIFVDKAGNPLVTAAPETQAIPSGSRLTAKGQPATQEQVKNANLILQKGTEMGANRKVLVASIMTAIAESVLINLTGGDRDSVGVFQQRPSQGWPATRDVPTDAAAFFKQAIQIDKQNPYISYGSLAQAVQRSFDPTGSNYEKWKQEASQYVTSYGVDPGTTPKSEKAQDGNPITENNTQDKSQVVANVQSGTFFTRGQFSQKGDSYLLTPENSWNCMQRLADDVNWRCFCVSGVIYFVSEQWLFKSKPFLTFSEDTPGIDWIDYDYDEGKKSATVTVTAHVSRWSVPPGCIVVIKDMGIVNGRWLVNSISRSLYETVATITLTKPSPVLPEPTSLSTLPSGFEAPSVGGERSGTPTVAQNQIQSAIVSYAQSQLGLPYRWGAEQPGVAFDCSGLTEATYNSVGIDIPRVAQAQYDFGPKLSKAEILMAGDLVFFGSPSAPGGLHHVAIYIGNGAIIHAPHTGDVVRVQENFLSAFSDYYGASRPWQR